MARDGNGVALNRAHRGKHLLSGLILCGDRGSPFVMRDARHHGCSTIRSKGACSNSLKVKCADLERNAALLAKLAQLRTEAHGLEVNLQSLNDVGPPAPLGVDVLVVARAGLRVTTAVRASLVVLGGIGFALIRALGVA